MTHIYVAAQSQLVDTVFILKFLWSFYEPLPAQLHACVWSCVSLLHYVHYFVACGGECAGVSGRANLLYCLFTLKILDKCINVHAKIKGREQRNQHFGAASSPITWCFGVSPKMEIGQITLVFLGDSLVECPGHDNGVKDYATISKSR